MSIRVKGHDLARKIKHRIYSKYPDVPESRPNIYTYYGEVTVKTYGQKIKNEAKSAKSDK
jgi:hypothetical protein